MTEMEKKYTRLTLETEYIQKLIENGVAEESDARRLGEILMEVSKELMASLTGLLDTQENKK